MLYLLALFVEFKLVISNEAMEAAALAGSEGFKWGAISGAISGGTREAFALKAATRSGLTMNEAAIIQQESGLPMDVISQLHSMDEYLVYKDAGLKPVMVNGRTALVQNIDLNYVSTLPDGSEVTNLVRMQRGYAPLDPTTGKAYQLHHIGQKSRWHIGDPYRVPAPRKLRDTEYCG